MFAVKIPTLIMLQAFAGQTQTSQLPSWLALVRRAEQPSAQAAQQAQQAQQAHPIRTMRRL